jgi:5-hydroxyisourate hydrolase
MGRLTTHVLDTANGVPAVGVAVELYALDGANRALIQSARTNADGRAPAPLLEGAAFKTGTYELAFDVGGYFKARGAMTADPPFLSVVTLRFTIADPDGHYHVPLLTSPWSYTTYRGS